MQILYLPELRESVRHVLFGSLLVYVRHENNPALNRWNATSDENKADAVNAQLFENMSLMLTTRSSRVAILGCF